MDFLGAGQNEVKNMPRKEDTWQEDEECLVEEMGKDVVKRWKIFYLRKKDIVF